MFNIHTDLILLTSGIGVTGSNGGPSVSHQVYLVSSVLIIVQQAPSLIVSLFDSLGDSVAYDKKKMVLFLNYN